MRVNGPSPQFGIAPAKTKRTGESGGSFELPEEAESGDAKSTARMAGASSLGSLIAAQLDGAGNEEWEEQRRRRKRNVRKGEDILDLLDGMKIDMLAGKLSPSHVLKLLDRIGTRQRDSGDERLEAILDEIELRARVELAKLKRRNSEEQNV